MIHDLLSWAAADLGVPVPTTRRFLLALAAAVAMLAVALVYLDAFVALAS
jgi:hypothetical protein